MLGFIFKKGFIATLAKVTGAILAYLYLGLIATNFGLDVSGIFAKYLLYSTLFSLLFKFGMDLAIIRLNEETFRRPFFAYTRILIITLLLSWPLLLFFQSILLYAFCSGVTLSVVSIFNGFHRAEGKPNLYSLNLFAARHIFLTILLFTVDSEEHILLLDLFALVLTLCISFPYQHWKDVIQSKISLNALSGIFKKSYPFLLTNSTFFVLSWISVFVLDLSQQPNEEVGRFFNIQKLASLYIFPLQAINAPISGMVANLWKDQQVKKIVRVFKIAFFLCFSAFLFVSIVLLSFGEMIFGFFDLEFTGNIPLFAILGVGYIINLLCGPVANILQMTGQEKTFHRIVLRSLLISIIGSPVLFYQFGLIGLAIASSASMIYWNINAYVVLKKSVVHAPRV